ncbi:MAG: metallophosphoesterase [Ignavibacteriales bacterium]|nr:metallophosphoesterase [Ignavibacteriales bacterium]
MNRTLQFIIFFSIAFILYTILNAYIFLKGWGVVPTEYRLSYVIAFVFLAYSYIAGRLLERVTLAWPTSGLVFIGAYWLSAMVYFFLMIYTIDVLRLINTFFPFFPSFLTANVALTEQRLAILMVGLVIVVVAAGHFNARALRVKRLELTIRKNSHPLKSLTIVAASDIHLGTIICKSRLEHIVEKINSLNPDLVLLPGDVVDEDLRPVIKQNLGETLRTIKSKYGVIACTGNHEYIGGVEEAYQYLTDHGIHVLRDSVVKIADSIFIVGREDRAIRQFAGKRRLPLDEIMKAVDTNYPVILMDHQPFRLDEAAAHGVDLQLSGHTHHGQLWPFNFISKSIFELSWGYKQKEQTHVYVSSGVGTWGPPIRTGNRPEIVHLRLTFQ